MTNKNEKTDKITLGLIASWGFGVTFLLGGVLALFEEPIFGISSIIASTLLLPPIRDYVHKKMKKSLSAGVRIILVLLLLGVGGSMLSDTGSMNTGSNGEGIMAALSSIDDRGLNVTDLKLSRGQYGNKVVTGILENTNNKQYSYVQVEINLYDQNNVQIGSTLANANHLEANGKWKFEAVIIQGNPTVAKVKGITAF